MASLYFTDIFKLIFASPLDKTFNIYSLGHNRQQAITLTNNEQSADAYVSLLVNTDLCLSSSVCLC